MLEKIYYICEYCKTQYKNKADCNKCEESHIKKDDLKIKELQYLPLKNDKKQFPVKIMIVNKFSGEEALYKRC